MTYLATQILKPLFQNLSKIIETCNVKQTTYILTTMWNAVRVAQQEKIFVKRDLHSTVSSEGQTNQNIACEIDLKNE